MSSQDRCARSSGERLTYDQKVGAAYLRLHDDGEDVGTVSSMPITPPGGARADDRIVLDLDDDGRLVGIECLTPEQRLFPIVLDSAEPHPH